MAIAQTIRGEALDLQHAAAFLPRVRIVSGTDPEVTKNSDLIIVTAGARQIPGKTRLDLLQRNVALYRKIVPPVAEHSPEALLLLVSNPVGVLTYVAWKLSGFPASRVIGSSTNLDSSRFREKNWYVAAACGMQEDDCVPLAKVVLECTRRWF